MNKREKLVLERFLDNEEAVLKRLRQVYNQSLKDVQQKAQALQDEINRLGNMASAEDDADEKARLVSMQQAKVYQKQYQDALKKQISSILDNMQVEGFKTVSDYLQTCYEDGFLGAVYDIHGQGIPLILPIDQEAVVRAVQLDSKISQGLYSRLGEDVATLKKKIIAQVSRGIATGMSYQQMAQQLEAYTKIGYNNAARITRTEGHRIQVQAGMDACYKAKDKGADVVKQWDATLDGKTRKSHRKVDGEIRDLDEKFSNGLRYPGDPAGGAAEVVHCRCALLQRARWALDDDELQTLQDRAKFFGLDKSASFDDFKKKYLNLPEESDTMNVKTLDRPKESSDRFYDKLFKLANRENISYRPVENRKIQITRDEMISVLAGGDNTAGSCASLGLAYIGQRQGWNVLDFRDGDSRKFFSSSLNLLDIANARGIKSIFADGKSSITVGNRLLKKCEPGKEYYLSVGRHAAIVRKLEDGRLQYLELQSSNNSGWTDFNGNPRYTLKTRFGCSQSIPGYYDFMIDIEESDFSTDEFKSLLGFINTAEDEQKKGEYGTIK